MNFAKEEYWKDYYSTPQQLPDFCIEIDKIYPIIQKHLPDQSKSILDAGCGTSKFLSFIDPCAYTSLFGIDFCSTAVSLLASNLPSSVTVKESDLTGPIEEEFRGKFYFIFDKFTLDTIACDDNGDEKVKKLLENYDQMLGEGGKAIFVSGGEEKLRMPAFKDIEGWKSVEVKKVEEEAKNTGIQIWIYVFEKMSVADRESKRGSERDGISSE